MGTRNLIVVIQENKVKVAQYGQYDGYFNCTGQLIKDFVQNSEKLEKLKQKIDLCTFLGDKGQQELEERIFLGEDVISEFPQLGRSMGVSVLDYIIRQEQEVILLNNFNFAQESLFCEYAYVINLDNSTVEFYLGFNTSKNVDFGYFQCLENKLNKDETYRTVALLKKYKFNRIPTMEHLNNLAKKFYKTLDNKN